MKKKSGVNMLNSSIMGQTKIPKIAFFGYKSKEKNAKDVILDRNDNKWQAQDIK